MSMSEKYIEWISKAGSQNIVYRSQYSLLFLQQNFFEATKNSSFTTFDGSLLIHLSKYDFLNMLSTKKGIPLHFYSRWKQRLIKKKETLSNIKMFTLLFW